MNQKYLFFIALFVLFQSLDMDAQRKSKKKKKGEEAEVEKPVKVQTAEDVLDSFLSSIKLLEDSTSTKDTDSIGGYTDTVDVQEFIFEDDLENIPKVETDTKKGKKKKTYKNKKQKVVPYFKEYEQEITAPVVPISESYYISLLKPGLRSHELIFYYGFMSIYSQPGSKKYQGQGIGIFNFSYRYNLSDGVAFGFDIGYENISPKPLDPKIQTDTQFRALTNDGSAELKYDQIYVMINSKWIYKKFETFELYSGVHLGFMSVNKNLIEEGNTFFSSFAYQIDLGGIGIGLTKNLKLYVEAGFGNMGKIKTGISYMY